jgi:glycerol-3-phosphate acyltransferase PlsY
VTLAVAIAVGYLLGSVPFGFLITRLTTGADIRRHGSGNIGATNVARLLGLGGGVATLLLDAGKGAAAVALARHLGSPSLELQVAAGLGAMLGHIFPVWLHGRGGKGVATMFGVFLMIAWEATLAALLLWVLAAALWRYASLSSLLAAVALPLLTYWLYAPGHHPPTVLSLGAAAAALLVVWRHRENLRRLLEGREPQLQLGARRRDRP